MGGQLANGRVVIQGAGRDLISETVANGLDQLHRQDRVETEIGESGVGLDPGRFDVQHARDQIAQSAQDDVGIFRDHGWGVRSELDARTLCVAVDRGDTSARRPSVVRGVQIP